MPNQRTFSNKPDPSAKQWYLVDAKDQTLGRIAVKIANILRGKNKPTYTPHIDNGDFVVVINADKVRVNGKKDIQKTYMSFSGYVGGHKSESFSARKERHPELLIERAVRGMIPHNRLGRSIYRKLRVYRGPEHPHGAQKLHPVAL